MSNKDTSKNKNLMFDGLPYRGDPVFLRKGDSTTVPVRGFESHVAILSTDDSDDMQKLESVLTSARKGWAFIEKMEEQYLTDKKTWQILIIWTDKFYEAPKKRG